MLANLNAQAKVGFDKVGYMGLNVGTTNVDLDVNKGLMTIATFKAPVNNGWLNFGGSADFKQKPVIFRTPGQMQIVKDVQINKEMADKLLSKINPIFFGVSSITGTANFQCDQLAVPITGGKPKDANIAGIISLKQVRMQPTGLLGEILKFTGASDGDLIKIDQTYFTVKDGFVNYPNNMQMDIGTKPIIFSGSMPLDCDKKFENFRFTMPGKLVKIGKESGSQETTVYFKGTRCHLDILGMFKDLAIQTGIETGLELLMQGVRKK
jgi:hypothetical protein